VSAPTPGQAYRIARTDTDVPILCMMFALCRSQATHLAPHPIIGHVPSCMTCAARLDIDLSGALPADLSVHVAINGARGEFAGRDD
jgi:hypothetical protein